MPVAEVHAVYGLTIQEMDEMVYLGREDKWLMFVCAVLYCSLVPSYCKRCHELQCDALQRIIHAGERERERESRRSSP